MSSYELVIPHRIKYIIVHPSKIYFEDVLNHDTDYNSLFVKCKYTNAPKIIDSERKAVLKYFVILNIQKTMVIRGKFRG